VAGENCSIGSSYYVHLTSAIEVIIYGTVRLAVVENSHGGA